MLYNKISGFSDEIASDINVQFEVLNKLGISYFEPRGVDAKNIAELTEEEMHSLKAKMDACGIKVSSIGSPIGKIKITEDFAEHFELFKNVVKAAKVLGTKYIRMFSFFQDGEWTEEKEAEVFARIETMLAYAKEQDVILLHENEKDIYGDIKERCLRIAEKFSCDNFAVVFDPANFVQCGQDTKEAFRMLRPYIKYMHIKDARFSDGFVVPPGTGDGCLKELLARFKEKDGKRFLTLEPHLRVFDGLASLEKEGGTADQIKEIYTYKTNEEAFAAAANALHGILAQI